MEAYIVLGSRAYEGDDVLAVRFTAEQAEALASSDDPVLGGGHYDEIRVDRWTEAGVDQTYDYRRIPRA